VIFNNFKKVRFSEAATLCIPHLVCALKDGNEAAQECAGHPLLAERILATNE
jgi:hypothetical protein